MYIGISGVINTSQQEQLNTWFNRFDTDRKLLLGVKAVHKTQYLDRENKYGRLWYPVGSEISHALTPDGSMCVAQTYLDYKDAETRGESRKQYEKDFMAKLFKRCESWINGIQFDMLPFDLYDYRDFFQSLKSEYGATIIIQAYGKVMERNTPKELVEKLRPYEGLADYILLDSSHGTGKRLDSEALRPFVEEIYSLDWIGTGVAGGLNQENIENELSKLLKDYPSLSFDAEGNLHGETGLLDMDTTKAYLETALKLTN